MIAFVEMIVTFAALTALCLFLNTKMRLAAGLTPLFVLCGTVVWYSTLGSVHMLVPAGIVWFGAAAAACVWLWRKHKEISAKPADAGLCPKPFAFFCKFRHKYSIRRPHVVSCWRQICNILSIYYKLYASTL